MTVRPLAQIAMCSALVMAAVLAAPAAAQSVRGVVTMPDGTTRASGVIVAATGDSGAPVRALTNQRGEFTIALPAAGRYALRALRVGFRPSTGPTVVVAHGSAQQIGPVQHHPVAAVERNARCPCALPEVARARMFAKRVAIQ